MPEETSPSGGLIIQNSGLVRNYQSSRLVARGILALDTPQNTVLEIRHLIAFETSVFVLTIGWDAWFDDPSNATDAWKARRKIVMYEFQREGAFVRKVGMSLLNFTETGYSRIQRRFPGKVTVRAGFIHFYEKLYIDTKERAIRTDYLYDRTGGRRVIWSTDAFVDQNRHNAEPTVPVAEWLRPEWFDGTRLVALYPRHESLGNPPPLNGTDEDIRPYAKTSKYLIVSQNAMQFMVGISALQEGWTLGQPTAAIGVSEHISSKAEFPVTTALYTGNRDGLGWNGSVCDSQGVWFQGYQGPRSPDLVWRLLLVGTIPQLTTFSLPHPYDLMRQEVITIFDSDGNIWIPSEIDCQKLHQVKLGECGEEGRIEDWYLDYKLQWSSGDDLIFSLNGQCPPGVDFDEVLLLFQVEADVLRVVKRLDPCGSAVSRLLERWLALPKSQKEGSYGSSLLAYMREDVLSNIDGHEYFADGYLYSISTYGKNKKAIAVTNVDTEVTTWFQPEVPAGEVE